MIVPVQEGLFELEGDRTLRLIGGFCPACTNHHFPRAANCPYCSADRCEARLLSAEGQVYLATVIHAAPPGYRGQVPYGFGIVELPEKIRVVTRLVYDGEVLVPGVAVRAVVDVLHRNEEGNDVVTFAFARVV